MKTEFPSLEGHGVIGVDCETFDPDLKKRGPATYRGGFIAGVAIATERGFSGYYPVAHESGENLPKEKVFGWLKQEMARKNPKGGANLLYDMGYLAEQGVRLAGPIRDVLLAEPLLDENRFSYDLDSIAKGHVGRGKDDSRMLEWITDRFGKKDPKSNIWRVPPEIAGPYAVVDAQLPIEVFKEQEKDLRDQGLWQIYELERDLLPMLLAMRKRGIRIDRPAARRLYQRLTEQQLSIERDVSRETGVDLDCWRASCLAEIFDKLGIEYPLTPKTKKPSFTSGFLDSVDNGNAELIRRVRKLDKLRGTFLNSQLLGNLINGRIHCSFNQLRSDNKGTVSGRLSCSFPNLQFIPVRTNEGKEVRRLFLPDKGQKFYHLDWSQIEYRLMVHDAAMMGLAGADEAVEAYKSPKADFHQIIADMTGLPRDSAKTINFGIAYGEGVDKLCRQLRLTRAGGEALLREYDARAPFIRRMLRIRMREAEQERVVTTLFGRRRRFDKWVTMKMGEFVFTDHKINTSSRLAGVHAALNARIQGSAADVMKKAMCEVWKSGVCDVIGVPQLTVHDELDGSYPDTRAGREAVAEIKHIMETTVDLKVPLIADLKTGMNWGECK